MGVMGGREGVMVMAVVAGVMARAPCTIEKHREMQVCINNTCCFVVSFICHDLRTLENCRTAGCSFESSALFSSKHKL